MLINACPLRSQAENELLVCNSVKKHNQKKYEHSLLDLYQLYLEYQGFIRANVSASPSAAIS
jgi:hypothetical protein